ncbi:lipopolysaccharide export system permease protein [Flavobacterium croceum DSM 17960]|uniref:Lipopolysaccharide export system permease protein n=1 Tax=Flavobacterium croceum DSM 17960 TaxID=1121886 RepID=A0A2S4N904_9FLAO|nr:LptF/LptG family permease [Flavobacterium croceum]POS02184.1 lipopolysaccharide export system permease protein [Flavobacterium croceum DSM 17960]
MKILDKYLLKSFLITFTTVFVILFFIFILQVVWLYISELAGKDLDFGLIMKFLTFKMPSLVPMVLPLSVLLSSIMTYGSLSENYEFAAMKSSGISLQRAIRPLVYFIGVLAVISFFFANNVIPFAEYKFVNFRRHLAQVKPAMAIGEGQLSEIGLYTIKVEKKSGPSGNLLSGVTIHVKLPNGEGNKTVIKAKSGELISSEDSNVLKLVLKDGYYYEDILPQKYEEREKQPFVKSSFAKDVIYMDLTKLNQTDQNQAEITSTSTMLTIGQLRYTIDSLKTNLKKDIISSSENLYQRTGVNSIFRYNTKPENFDYNNMLKDFDDSEKLQILTIAKSSIENTGFSIETSKLELENKQKNINLHWISFWEKFMIAFSCILMFFIGAPLGAIIRKGGMGLPIVFAMAIFIIFHFVNTFGKKVAQEGGIPAFFGVWLSTLVLIPLAVYLTKTAINDIGGLITLDQIGTSFKNLLRLNTYQESPDENAVLVDIENYAFTKDDAWYELEKLSTQTLINVVKYAKKNNYSFDYRTKALLILNERGITQEQLAETNNLHDSSYTIVRSLLADYKLHARITLFFSILTFVLSNALVNKINVITILGFVVSLVLYYVFLAISKSNLKEIEKISNKQIIDKVYTLLYFMFPLYIIGYFTYNKHLKKAFTDY